MSTYIRRISKRIATRRGVIITSSIWLLFVLLFSFLAPTAKQFSVHNVTALYPENSPSVVAKNKIDTYFAENDGVPGILVFHTDANSIAKEVHDIAMELTEKQIPNVTSVMPLHALPEDITASFIANDNKTAFLPILFSANATAKEINKGLDTIEPLLETYTGVHYYMTGPAGIAVDTSALFSRADLVLLFATIGIVLLLLIITYRSPFLALIPLTVAIIVYAITDRVIGLFAKNGVEVANQSLSIMTIFLFALIVDYSLFIFSRYREELKREQNKYVAMQRALAEISVPIFYSGATVFVAMIILFMTQFGDYKNFAPVFSTAVIIIIIAALTLVPALFTLVGRKAFWPNIPQVGEQTEKPSALWGKIAHVVTNKPILCALIVFAFLIVSGLNVFTISYEYNTMKSFPDDMPSRVGYSLLEEKFSRGVLAPTSILLEAEEQPPEENWQKLIHVLEEKPLVDGVKLVNFTSDGKAFQFELTFLEDPYDRTTIDALEQLMVEQYELLATAEIDGELYFAGETAAALDSRHINVRDLIVIVVLETMFIFGMLIFFTRSISLPALMMGTILLSFTAALGLGTFLSGLLFDVTAISNRVPVYAFVFLIALGIDYNIFLVSRFLEEKNRRLTKEAVQVAVERTGGVISSAGIILAATFAVLMTQPVEVLATFGFIVAIGILFDTFIVRGVLLPSLLVLFQKNKPLRLISKRKKKTE